MKEAELVIIKVRDKYAAKLDEVCKQIAADAAADPKAPPDIALTTERWQLQGKVKLAETLRGLFAELDS